MDFLKDSCKLKIHSVTYIILHLIMQSLRYYYTFPTSENRKLYSVSILI